MDWKHGYYADSGYTFGYYNETMPSRLYYAALIQGQRAPRAVFRYLDAGCGQGLNLILAAASHPESEFVGVDFLPEHIAHATALAQQAGLTNVSFIEGDFVELAADPFRFGQFDYAVCHGITTWIAPAVKEALFKWVGQVLKPGGVFYNSYNTFPGWLSAVPFQHLVLLEQRTKTGALALQAARASMDGLMKSAKAMFNALPSLEARLKTMESQDPAYLVQEYNNQFWQPVFVTQMMDAMAVVKLRYLGTATLPEAYDNVVSSQVRDLLVAQTDPTVREQLRDYAIAQSFRRDLYVKGQHKPWSGESESLVKEIRVIRNSLVERPQGDQAYVVKAGALEINGQPVYYGKILDLVESSKEGKSVDELLKAQSNPSERQGLVQALSMLIHGGWLMLFDPEKSVDSAQRLNGEITRAVLQGAPYRYLALPRAMSAVGISDTEWAMLDAVKKGIPPAQWPALVAKDLAKRGRSLAKDGQAVSDPAVQQSMLAKGASDFVSRKLPLLTAAGAIS